MSALLSFKVNTLEHHCNFVWRSSVAGPHYRCQIISRQIVLARKYLSPMDSQTGPSYRELTPLPNKWHGSVSVYRLHWIDFFYDLTYTR